MPGTTLNIADATSRRCGRVTSDLLPIKYSFQVRIHPIYPKEVSLSTVPINLELYTELNTVKKRESL